MSKLTHFTILGERCSGTTFLQVAIQENFNLEVTWDYGWKHFFGFNSYANSDHCLFISIIRHPLDWVNSFFNTPHHLAGSLRGNIHTFLSSQFFSVYDSGKGKQGRDMVEDYHIHEKRRYSSIFELRYTKADFQKNVIPEKVMNHIFIKYEDLRDNYQDVMTEISDLFHLQQKHNPFKAITGYKGGNKPFPRPSGKTFTHIDILHKIDAKKELEYGYDIIAEWNKINGK